MSIRAGVAPTGTVCAFPALPSRFRARELPDGEVPMAVPEPLAVD